MIHYAKGRLQFHIESVYLHFKLAIKPLNDTLCSLYKLTVDNDLPIQHCIRHKSRLWRKSRANTKKGLVSTFGLVELSFKPF